MFPAISGFGTPGLDDSLRDNRSKNPSDQPQAAELDFPTMTQPQLLSSLGAILVLIAYGSHQLKWMRSDRVPYNLMNLVGGALLAYVALRPFQVGFFIMEGSWTVISSYGLVRSLARLVG